MQPTICKRKDCTGIKAGLAYNINIFLSFWLVWKTVLCFLISQHYLWSECLKYLKVNYLCKKKLSIAFLRKKKKWTFEEVIQVFSYWWILCFLNAMRRVSFSFPPPLPILILYFCFPPEACNWCLQSEIEVLKSWMWRFRERMKKTFPAWLVAGNTRNRIQNILFPTDFFVPYIIFIFLSNMLSVSVHLFHLYLVQLLHF